MPEGPEVKRIAAGLESLQGKTIASGQVVSGRYLRGQEITFETIIGAKVERVICKGKLIAFHLKGAEGPLAILSTMGMMGRWIVLTEANSDLDAHRRVELTFDDGTIAAFFDPRNFGTFKIVSYAEMKRKMQELGPDILTAPGHWHAIALPEFYERVRRFGKDLSLAEGLLDQRICSGCGNYIRADAMWLARFSPKRRMSEMTDADLKRIWIAMHEIAIAAAENKVPPLHMDGEGHHSALIQISKEISAVGEFFNLAYGQPETASGGMIESYKDSNGRTVWWCPKEQK